MNTFYIDNNVIFEGEFDMHECVSRLVEPNAIIYISVDVELSTDTTLGANSILVFQNGAKLWANTLVTVTGNNTSIEAPMATVFGANIQLGGSFLNAEWPVEWWGAKSDGTDAAPAINRALEQIANTDKQGTLLLADRYEVRDTIYMQPGVAISGTSSTYSHRFYPNTQTDMRGTLVANFVDSNNNYSHDKWVIDTRFVNGNTIPCHQLYIDLSQSGSSSLVYTRYAGCNITNLHIVDKDTDNPHTFFGGIRIHSMQAATIRNVDIEAHAFIGLALVGKVWLTSIDNVYVHACGCGLYIGSTCTTLVSNNLGLHRWTDARSNDYFRLALPADYQGDLVKPIMQPNTLPPYWDAENMRSCAIIMEHGSHCTFTSACAEYFDAVICGTDYNAKFISPYIEKINYFFAWLYCSEQFSMPNKRYELIIEDLVHGFETFPSMITDSNGYKYLEWVECEPSGSRDTQASYGYYRFLPTFGTFQGVIKAHNVGRATCWENDFFLDTNNKPLTWNYPSYFIYVTPGIRQRNFYYDKYKVMASKAVNPATQALEVVESHLEDVGYCRYKKIIIEGSPYEPVRYYYDETNDAVYDVTEDNKAEMDIYKRALQLGVSRSDVVLCGELFERGLDNFIMTPVYSRSQINYGGVVRWKRFCIEIIDAANVVQFVQPLKLHGCEVTFKNSCGSTAAFQKKGMPHLLEISGDCTLIFEGDFSRWNTDNTQTPPTHPPFGELIKLVGDRHIKLTVRLINAPSLVSYFSQASNFITNSGSFTPGYDLDVETF